MSKTLEAKEEQRRKQRLAGKTTKILGSLDLSHPKNAAEHRDTLAKEGLVTIEDPLEAVKRKATEDAAAAKKAGEAGEGNSEKRPKERAPPAKRACAKRLLNLGGNDEPARKKGKAALDVDRDAEIKRFVQMSELDRAHELSLCALQLEHIKEAYANVAADRSDIGQVIEELEKALVSEKAKTQVANEEVRKSHEKVDQLEKEFSREKQKALGYKGGYATLSQCMQKFKDIVLSFLVGSRLETARAFMESATYKLATQDIKDTAREEGFFSCIGQLKRVKLLPEDFDVDACEDMHAGRRDDMSRYPDEIPSDEMHHACEFGELVTDPEVPYLSKPSYLPRWVPECIRAGLLLPFEKAPLRNAHWIQVNKPVMGREEGFVEPELITYANAIKEAREKDGMGTCILRTAPLELLFRRAVSPVSRANSRPVGPVEGARA